MNLNVIVNAGLQNYSSGPLEVLRDGGNIAHVQVVASREQQLALWSAPGSAHPLAAGSPPGAVHPLPALTITYDVDRTKAASGDLLVRKHPTKQGHFTSRGV